MKKTLLLVGIPIVTIVIFFLVYFPTLTRYRELKIEEELLEEKIQAIDEKINALREEKELLENDKEYIEKVIRDELGLVRPGEVVYKFIEEQQPAEEVVEAVVEDSEESLEVEG